MPAHVIAQIGRKQKANQRTNPRPQNSSKSQFTRAVGQSSTVKLRLANRRHVAKCSKGYNLLHVMLPCARALHSITPLTTQQSQRSISVAKPCCDKKIGWAKQSAYVSGLDLDIQIGVEGARRLWMVKAGVGAGVEGPHRGSIECCRAKRLRWMQTNTAQLHVQLGPMPMCKHTEGSLISQHAFPGHVLGCDRGTFPEADADGSGWNHESLWMSPLPSHTGHFSRPVCLQSPHPWPPQ